MNLKARAAPHIRYEKSTRGVMLDVIASLCFLYGMAVYYHGPRALALGLVSVGTCLFCDIFCNLLYKKRHNFRDLSAIVTGMILPLMMPASIPYGIAVTAAAFGILVAKHPFGGTGHNVFNPVAAGFSFAAICFGNALFTYPPPALMLPVTGTMDFAATISPAYTLMLRGVPGYGALDMILGKYPGPMGATNILVLIACLLFLVFRGTVRWSVPVTFLATVALCSWVFPRSSVGGLGSVGYELATGLLLFTGIFLLGDPVTTPKREMAKIAFAFVTGIVAMLFRHFGSIEEEITFSLLLMNGAVWGFDMVGERVAGKLRRRKLASLKGEAAAKEAKA